MAIEFRAISHSGDTPFSWPPQCAACGRKSANMLKASYAATSDAKYFGVYASWKSQPISIQFPVCKRHYVGYALPMALTTTSLGHTVFMVIAALAFIGGILGVGRIAFGTEVLTTAAIQTYLALLFPGACILLARTFAPVRITHFAPPVVWIRIRRNEFAEAFAKLNPTAVKSSK
jgi:hypothetical protein